MGYSSRLQRGRSCSCPPLDIANWCSGRCRASQRFSDDYCEDEEFDYSMNYYYNNNSNYYNPPGQPKCLSWRGIWRRIVKEKQKMFESTAVLHKYDPHSYAQNFDDGPVWDVEPEILSRSFSARFAVQPSKRI